MFAVADTHSEHTHCERLRKSQRVSCSAQVAMKTISTSWCHNMCPRLTNEDNDSFMRDTKNRNKKQKSSLTQLILVVCRLVLYSSFFIFFFFFVCVCTLQILTGIHDKTDICTWPTFDLVFSPSLILHLFMFACSQTGKYHQCGVTIPFSFILILTSERSSRSLR